jgi:hypothetical protein
MSIKINRLEEGHNFVTIKIIERIQLKLCKLLLHLKSSTPDYMVYSELGRYPISIDIKVRMKKSGVSLLWENKVSFFTYVIHYFTTIIL